MSLRKLFVWRKRIFVTHRSMRIFKTSDFTFSYWKTNIELSYFHFHTTNRHSTLKKNQTYRFYFKQPRRKSCHVAASIPFSLDTLIVEREFRLQQHQIHFLSHNEENSSSSLVYSIQRKIILLSNEILSSTFSMKRFSWRKNINEKFTRP